MEEVDQMTSGVWAAVLAFIDEFQVPIRIVVILVLAFVVHWVLRRLLKRFIEGVVSGVKKNQNVEATTEIRASPLVKARAIQRTRTLGGIGRSLITWVIVIIATVMVLGQLNFNLTAILASAGVAAAGLAFGAQNVIKDILNGVFMVFEDQLGVGDLVTIGEITGTVEDVGIRVTQLRALDGTLWFVRNGEVLTLGNASQGWGRALVDITIDANNDLELAERVATEAAHELAHDPEYIRKVTGEPEVWGLESVFGDRATLRMVMMTRPEAQWGVQRALRARLKTKFAEAGITLAAELPNYPGGTQ
ncbi:mechanosensitive ion channel [Leucobacter tardus]